VTDKEYIKEFKNKNQEQREWTMQKYICNQFEFKGEMVAIRSFWMVSLRMILKEMTLLHRQEVYQDGYVRYGYREKDMAKTTKDRLESTFSEFEEWALLPFVKKNSQLRRQIKHPLNHIQNQMKESIATFVDAFKSQAFNVDNPVGAEDGFEY
jgi:hypothetical protein